jgi:phosphatidylglycerophosphatase A
MKRWLVSCFGLGYLPVAPGTWGSLPPAIIFALMYQFGVPGLTISIVMAVLTIVGSLVCVWLAPVVIAATGKSDPREVVVDEFAGQALTFLQAAFLIPDTFTLKQVWITAIIGFLLFRLFDIVKPWPIHGLQKLPRGWGILIDDLLAGVYAAICLIICVRLWIAP